VRSHLPLQRVYQYLGPESERTATQQGPLPCALLPVDRRVRHSLPTDAHCIRGCQVPHTASNASYLQLRAASRDPMSARIGIVLLLPIRGTTRAGMLVAPPSLP
jgi:hypothetical protein